MITDYLKSEDKFELAVKTIDDESREYIDSAIKRFDDLLEQDSEDFRKGVVASLKMIFEFMTRLNALTMKLVAGTDVKLDLLWEYIGREFEEKVFQDLDQDTSTEQ